MGGGLSLKGRRNVGRFWSWYSRGLGWIVRATNLVSAACVLILMVLVIADILGRYLFNSPVPMTYEVGSFLMVFVVFLGLAYTQRMGAHIRVEFLTLRLSPRVRAILDIAASVLGLLLYGIVTYQSFIWAWDSWQVGDYVAGLINIPRWPSQFVVPLGAALLCLQFLADVAQRVAELKSPRTLDGQRREE
jgi:TRAP-type C4-dicarboxylate transport system permease small subunit